MMLQVLAHWENRVQLKFRYGKHGIRQTRKYVLLQSCFLKIIKLDD